MNSNSFKIFVWASDVFKNSGEGKLAILYLFEISNKYHDTTIKVRTLDNVFYIKNSKILSGKLLNSNILNFSFTRKYISPTIGLIYLWINFFQKKKNYLFKLFTFMEFYYLFV